MKDDCFNAQARHAKKKIKSGPETCKIDFPVAKDRRNEGEIEWNDARLALKYEYYCSQCKLWEA